MAIQDVINNHLAGRYAKVTKIVGREPIAMNLAIDGEPVYSWFGGLGKDQRARMLMAGFAAGNWKMQHGGLQFGWH